MKNKILILALIFSLKLFGQNNYVNIPNDKNQSTKSNLYTNYFDSKLDTLLLGEWELKKAFYKQLYSSNGANNSINIPEHKKITIYKDSITTLKNERFYTRTNFSYLIKDKTIKTYSKIKKKIKYEDEYEIEICTPELLILSKISQYSQFNITEFFKIDFVYIKSTIDSNEVKQFSKSWYFSENIFQDSVLNLKQDSASNSFIIFENKENLEIEFSLTVGNSKNQQTTIIDGVYLNKNNACIDTKNNLLYLFFGNECYRYLFEIKNETYIKLTKI